MADNLDPVIKTIIAEALGEGQTGMQMVGETILNRANQRGLSPGGVVMQPGQYEGYYNPGSAAQRAFNDPAVVTAAQAAWELAQQPGDPTGGANHYFNPNIVQPSWARSMTPTTTYGGHAFYTDRPVTQQVAQSGNAPSPQTQSNSIQRQRDLIPSLGSGASPALQQAMAMLASSGSNPYPQTQSGDMRLMRNPLMSATAAQQQVTPWPANQSDDMLLRRNANVGTTIGTVPTTGIGQPPRNQMVQGIPFNQNGNALTEATRRAALLANQSYVGQGATGGTGNPGYSAALNEATRRAALMANQGYAGQETMGNLRNVRLGAGSPYQAYDVAANGPPGLTRQQYEALNSTGQMPLNNAPTPLTASTRLQTIRNGGATPFPMMASAGLQAQRNGTPMMGAAAQGVAPVGSSPLRVVVNGAGSYNGTPQPVQQPVGFTPVQTLQQQGLSNAQAYNLLNSLNRGSLGVGDRITGAGTQASSGASANSIYG